ncbi:MAG: hypothetical protein L0338_32950, partial [Acidobacteria bacterium]|nr:hypothetical protein [Acidobacteriota bacterium]
PEVFVPGCARSPAFRLKAELRRWIPDSAGLPTHLDPGRILEICLTWLVEREMAGGSDALAKYVDRTR